MEGGRGSPTLKRSVTSSRGFVFLVPGRAGHFVITNRAVGLFERKSYAAMRLDFLKKKNASAFSVIRGVK